jgi:hypothetical protein
MNGPAWQRPIFLSLGLACVGIGMVGVVLPILPTTPFMILATLCFAKSSERLNHWLYAHRLFGPTLIQWDRYRVIPPIAKFIALAAMIASMVYVVAFSPIPWPAVVALAAVCAFGASYILSKPSRIPAE